MSNRTRLTLAGGAAALALVGATSSASALPAFTTGPTTYTNPKVVGQPMIVNLRVSEHKRFDRVVIDVAGRRPSFKVRYVKKLVYDGSGSKVPLAGKKRMALSLEPARAHDDTGKNVYVGPRLKQYDLPTLRGVAFTGDFEGVVSFGFTTSRKAPYRAFTLTDPSRVVIDFQH